MLLQICVGRRGVPAAEAAAHARRCAVVVAAAVVQEDVRTPRARAADQEDVVVGLRGGGSGRVGFIVC